MSTCPCCGYVDETLILGPPRCGCVLVGYECEICGKCNNHCPHRMDDMVEKIKEVLNKGEIHSEGAIMSYIAVAKFYVASVQKFGQPNYQTGAPETNGIRVDLNPVPYKPDDPTHENSKFWTASPSGKMELSIQNKELFDRFEVGREIYLPMIQADGVTLEELSGAIHRVLNKD